MVESVVADKGAQANWKAYMRGRDAGHDKYVDLANKCNRFYLGGGEQWDPADRAQLESEGRPVLEINMVLSTVNAILGEYSTQRADITFKPRKDGTADTASALSELVLQIQDNNRYEYVETEVFSDGVIEDRGYFDIRLNFDDHMMGEIEITSEDGKYIIPDPEANSYDPKGWKEVTKVRWMTLDDIEQYYGKDKRQQVENNVSDGDTFGFDSVKFKKDENSFGNIDQYFVQGDDGSRKIQRVRVLERQHRKLTLADFWVDNETGDMRIINDKIPEERRKQIAAELNLSIVRKLTSRVRWTVSADKITLRDSWSPYKNFTIVPYFPYFRRGKPMGVVRNLLSPQEQLNKIESQELHIINTTSNSGWVVEAGSLTNMTVDELEERGAETGLVLVFGKGRQAPEKIKSNGVPSGIDHAANKAANNVRTISGVNESMLAMDNPKVSGVALQNKQARGMVQLQPIFDNLNLTRRLLADRMLEIIQDYYTETRVIQVVDREDPNQGMKEVVINEVDTAGQIINDLTLGEYGVVVSSAPARDTFMETQFAEALSLRNAGVEIPDDVVIEASNLANKRAIAKRVRDMQGMGELTPEQQEYQAFVQDIEMQLQQLSVEEAAAKVEKLSAEAALSHAKANATSAEAETEGMKVALQRELDLAKMRKDLTEKMMDFNNKLQLANLHTKARTNDNIFTQTTKRLSEERRLSTPQKQNVA